MVGYITRLGYHKKRTQGWGNIESMSMDYFNATYHSSAATGGHIVTELNKQILHQVLGHAAFKGIEVEGVGHF